jgi:hypothetical protein
MYYAYAYNLLSVHALLCSIAQSPNQQSVFYFIRNQVIKINAHEERYAYGSRTWGDSTHKQACLLQAITVATVNSTYDWMANKARRTLEDVIKINIKPQGFIIRPPLQLPIKFCT